MGSIYHLLEYKNNLIRRIIKYLLKDINKDMMFLLLSI